MARYTDEQRGIYLLQLEAAGYPDNEHAPWRVAKQKGAPHGNTLKRWWRANQPHLTKVVQQKKPDLIQAIKEEMQDILGDMPDARKDASYRDMAVAFGILAEKYQLLTGGPTANINTNTRVRFIDYGLDDSSN
jgi:hypothetical protein